MRIMITLTFCDRLNEAAARKLAMGAGNGKTKSLESFMLVSKRMPNDTMAP